MSSGALEASNEDGPRSLLYIFHYLFIKVLTGVIWELRAQAGRRRLGTALLIKKSSAHTEWDDTNTELRLAKHRPEH